MSPFFSEQDLSMPSHFRSLFCGVVLVLLLPFLLNGLTGENTVQMETAPSTGMRNASSFPSAAEEGEGEQRYTSHYLVFGTRDEAGSPRIVAIDFNRTAKSDSVAYEYKLFLAQGADWSMPVYETWTVPQSAAPRPFPSRGGLNPTLDDGSLSRVTTTLPDTDLTVTLETPTFSFPTEKGPTGNGNASRTGHPEFTVRWNGTIHQGRGIYEHIRPTGEAESEEAVAERNRQIQEESRFGLYDWIVLYDENGRLWQVSQGTLTEDFAYQQSTKALPRETHDVLVRWTATAYDSTAGQHTPTRWLVDVPAWQMRVQLRTTGEHRGHGPARSDGTRAIYVQAGVEGTGTVHGQKHRFFGMVEHIRD